MYPEKESGNFLPAARRVLLKSLFSILIPAIWAAAPLSSPAQCPVTNTAFGSGEEITYTASYNWGPVWIDAGTVKFTVTSETFRDKPTLHLRGSGKSYQTYDLLFKVRDYFDSWIDPVDFRTYEFRRNTSEGGYSIINTQYYNHASGQITAHTKTNNDPVRKAILPVRPCSFDMLSAIYYTRTLDFNALLSGQKKQITVLIDDAYFDIYIRALGKETIESTDGKRYRCIKFAAKMVQGTIFKGEEDVLVWVTDDANKIPVYIEAKIIVGTVKAYLNQTKGLKNPMTALVR